MRFAGESIPALGKFWRKHLLTMNRRRPALDLSPELALMSIRHLCISGEKDCDRLLQS